MTNVSNFVADTKDFSTSLRLVEKSLADTHEKIKVGMAEHCTKLTPDDLFYDLKYLHIPATFIFRISTCAFD